MKRLEIVEGIPVDQNAKATIDIKRFLLTKLAVIKQNREIIDASSIRKKQENVLDAYKKAVKFDAAVRRIDNAEKELEEAQQAILKLGLSKDGYLLEVHHGDRHGNTGDFIQDPKSSYTYIRISKSDADKIKETRNLIKAVQAEMSVFSSFDQLETRMMLASTVGECMAIVNAVADRDVFKVDQLMLTGPSEKGK